MLVLLKFKLKNCMRYNLYLLSQGKGKGKGKSSMKTESDCQSTKEIRKLRTLDVFAGCGGTL